MCPYPRSRSTDEHVPRLMLCHHDFEVLAWHDERVHPTAIHSTEQFHEISLQHFLRSGIPEGGERPIGRAKIRFEDL